MWKTCLIHNPRILGMMVISKCCKLCITNQLWLLCLTTSGRRKLILDHQMCNPTGCCQMFPFRFQPHKHQLITLTMTFQRATQKTATTRLTWTTRWDSIPIRQRPSSDRPPTSSTRPRGRWKLRGKTRTRGTKWCPTTLTSFRSHQSCTNTLVLATTSDFLAQQIRYLVKLLL